MQNPFESYSAMSGEPDPFAWRRPVAIALTGITLAMTAFTEVNNAADALTACRQPSAEALQTVTELSDAPAPEPPNLHGDKYERRKQRTEFEKQTIEDLGIVLPKVDYARLSMLEVGLSDDEKSQSFVEYLDMARQIMNQSHIPIHVMKPEEASALRIDASVPTQAELESHKAKYQVLQLIKMFGYAPINFTSTIGVKEVILTARGKVDSDFGGYAGLAFTEDGILIVDIANAGEGQYGIPEHELFHLFNAFYCGARKMDNDPGYSALSENGTYAGKWPLPPSFLDRQPKTFAAVEDEFYRLSTVQFEARARGDRVAYCEAEAQISNLLRGVEELNDYSYTAVVEGEANIGGQAFNPFSYTSMLDRRMPVIRKKFLHILAEIYETHPNVARYYAYTAKRRIGPAYIC